MTACRVLTMDTLLLHITVCVSICYRLYSITHVFFSVCIFQWINAHVELWMFLTSI